MLQLLAIAEEDGWAYVRTGDELVVTRPPYQGWCKVKATESILEQAICRHGFRQTEGQFSDWRALIHYLKQAQLAAWKAQETSAFTGQEIKELIHELSAEELEAEFLDRVEKELFPQDQWNVAARLLTDLLGVRVVRESNTLNQRTVTLLKHCQKKLAARASDPAEELARQFPNLKLPFVQFARNRAADGSPF